MRLILALAALLPLARPPRAETLVETLGPLRLKGIHQSMQGPFEMKTIQFERPGWIRSVSLRLLDARGRRSADTAVFCHAIFRAPAQPIEVDGKIFMLGRNFPLAPDQDAVKFPAGFGLHVDTVSLYVLEGMLQSPDKPRDAVYTMRVDIDFVDDAHAVGIKPLHHLSIRIDPNGADGGRALTRRQIKQLPQGARADLMHMWWVPPGRHEYATSFTLPRAILVHAATVHIHRFGAGFALRERRTGRVILSGAPPPAAREMSEVPFYSDARGLRLDKGVDYEFSVVYDNPGPAPTSAMGTLHLFFDPDDASGGPR